MIASDLKFRLKQEAPRLKEATIGKTVNIANLRDSINEFRREAQTTGVETGNSNVKNSDQDLILCISDHHLHTYYRIKTLE